jgi:hypothetical protein
MAVYFPDKFVYLANARTASKATRNALFTIGGSAVLRAGHHVHRVALPSELQKLQAVTTVRNPYDALVTWYIKRRDASDNQSFARFLAEPAERTHNTAWAYPDSVFVHHDADVFLRYETLQDDLSFFLELHGLPPVQLPKDNITNDKRHYRSYYTSQETIDRATELCQRDLDLYGYPKLEL